MTDPARWHEFAYLHTDIPAGTTIHDWRAQRAPRKAPGLWSRLARNIRHRIAVAVRRVVARPSGGAPA